MTSFHDAHQHLALEIPEILLAIFQRSSQDTLAKCCLVSRRWNAFAADVLWRKVTMWEILGDRDLDFDTNNDTEVCDLLTMGKWPFEVLMLLLLRPYP